MIAVNCLLLVEEDLQVVDLNHRSSVGDCFLFLSRLNVWEYIDMDCLCCHLDYHLLLHGLGWDGEILGRSSRLVGRVQDRRLLEGVPDLVKVSFDVFEIHDFDPFNEDGNTNYDIYHFGP